ncbi:response regulator [Patescibacteria group bacterium]|jgi:DNA-binding response OmpR family regulator|nr:response regulator [Patescibacteria group bacterium]
MKILIIEDEKALAEVLRLQFEELNYNVEVVMDGAKAVGKAREFHPDIILLDLLLPHKGGFEILEGLKGDAKLKNIPVIISSSLDQDEDIKKGLRLGAIDYFVKSQHPIKELVEKVRLHTLKNTEPKKKKK